MSKYVVKHQPKSVIEVKMEISSAEITEAYKRALKKRALSVAISGFRKGKAPENMVEDYIGKEKIYEEALS